jgi:hypothetical protein
MAREGLQEAAVNIVVDLSALAPSAFWQLLDERGWCRLLDSKGIRQPFSKMSMQLYQLADGSTAQPR